MKMPSYLIIIVAFYQILLSCHTQPNPVKVVSADRDTVSLPEPYATNSTVKLSEVIGWPENKTPISPAGFTISRFATQLNNPRWIYVAPNNDVFVSEASTNKSKSSNDILLFRTTPNGTNNKTIFIAGLNQPFGMLMLENYFYVGCTDGLYRFPYVAGATSITAKGEKILELPAGGYNNHWTRNVIANKEGSKLYISVGSGSNVGEHGMENEIRRANILEINPDGTGEKIYANGIRNPVGMGWQPNTNVLWAAVNERDNLGDELVPDYLTSVKQGGFYGWPYAYYGNHPDPRMKGERPDLVAKAIIPDVSLGAHTASLGLAFYDKDAFPTKYKKGAFIGQHGSWNRSIFAGYKVVFVPFINGKPQKPEDFLTGFIADENKNTVYGRPVGVAVTADGSLLVADDAGNTIWKVTAKK